mgnify:CR=1 FL=1
MCCCLSFEWGCLLIFHSAWVVSFAQIIMIVTKDEPTGIQMPSICWIRFQAVKFGELETISIHDEMKKELRKCLDQLYGEYVGIHLKAKKFIDSLGSWGEILKDQSGGKK